MNALGLTILFLIMSLSVLELKYNNEFISRILLIIVIIIFLGLVAYRDIYTVPDSLVYAKSLSAFEHFQIYKSRIDIPFGFGKGFAYLTQIINFFYKNNIKFYFSVIAIVNISIIIIAMNTLFREDGDKKNLLIGFLLYISFYGFLYNAIVLRAGIALSLIVLAFVLITKKKKIKAWICMALAISFHDTAIIGLIPFLIGMFEVKLDKKHYIILLSIIFSLFIINSNSTNITDYAVNFLMKFSNYLYRAFYLERLVGGSESVFSLKYFYFLLIALYGTYCFDSSEKYKKLLLIYDIGLLFWMLIPFTRIGDFCVVFSFLLEYYIIINNKNIMVKIFLYIIFMSCNLILVLRILKILN